MGRWKRCVLSFCFRSKSRLIIKRTNLGLFFVFFFPLFWGGSWLGVWGLAPALRRSIKQKRFILVGNTGGFWRYNGRSKLIPDIPRFGYGELGELPAPPKKAEYKGERVEIFSAQRFEKILPVPCMEHSPFD